MKSATKSFLYNNIASAIEEQIQEGVLKFGDKLPSVRILKKEYGVSVSTVLEAYYRLEAKSLIEARPRSGYYVVYTETQSFRSPIKTAPKPEPVLKDVTEIIIDFYQRLNDKNLVNLSLGIPSPELIPVAKLNKTINETVSKLPDGGSYYDTIQGSINLRRQIAQRTLLWGGKLKEDDIVTTTGCTSALSLALMATTKAGDTIIVESPVFFGILQLANALGLKVLELPTDATTGIDIQALKKVIVKQEINAIILMPNFNNPLGSIMPDEHKKEIVNIIQKHQIPLIEDDIYGDVYFGKKRPSTCRYYDNSGLVIWLGSFSKTIAGGYRVGWIAPGKFLAEVLKLKLCLSSSSPTITQEAIANFLANGRYDYHLRKLRQTYYTNSLKYIAAIAAYFPKDTRVSKPKGSFLLWVELNPKIDVSLLYKKALEQGIIFTPGNIFTLQDQYKNCMRLSYGMPWNEKIEEALKKLGGLVKDI